MRFGSVCSGIEAASVAWESLGWQASWLAEIEPFPSAVLKHHWPEVANIGDMTLLPNMIKNGEVEAPDVFVGGTPCQSFSIAGLRKGLSDDRGNLTLTFVEIANAIDNIRRNNGERESIIVWENVPGVLSSKDNAFGCFLAGLCGERDPLQPTGARWSNAGCVYGPQRAVAWRVLDAQFFGVAQRRRRVFVVASARAGFDPATVLFEFDGLRRDTPPSREKGEDAAERTASGAKVAIGNNLEQNKDVAKCLTAGVGQRYDFETETFILKPIALAGNTIGRQSHNGGNGNGYDDSGICYKLTSADVHGVAWQDIKTISAQVRRLTPTECERLQGFQDGHTAISWRGKLAKDCPDSPRYKALGNSMAVPVMRWIGNRIDKALKQ